MNAVAHLAIRTYPHAPSVRAAAAKLTRKTRDLFRLELAAGTVSMDEALSLTAKIES